MDSRQLPLFSPETYREYDFPFPSTRYQGSKRALVEWIWENTCHLQFDTVLDVFGGTGVVSYMFKNAGKQVLYNDALSFNWNIGFALVENKQEMLTDEEVDLICEPQPDITYPDFIQRTFSGIYFTDQENAWLDRVTYNIDTFANEYKRAVARFALFQACIIKRPYNLFHRANLYMRTANVARSFGNKTTWDTDFEVHFRKFVAEANQAIFDNGRDNRAISVDALDTPTGMDLVYLDPPYLNQKGVGVNYRDFYHFLEGLMHYEDWDAQIDYASKHRRLQPKPNPWNSALTIEDAFAQLIEHHRNSILVISYRNDGIPSKQRLIEMLRAHKGQVYEAAKPKKYVLSHANSHELLLIAH